MEFMVREKAELWGKVYRERNVEFARDFRGKE